MATEMTELLLSTDTHPATSALASRRAGSAGAVGCGRFTPPQPAARLALRSAVLERLTNPSLRVALMTAPAGYGKTSHAAAWVASDGRSAGWFDFQEHHNDAPVLLTDLTAALTAITDFDGRGVAAAGAGPDGYATGVAAALGRALRDCTDSFLLVIDDVHHLNNPSASDLVDALVSNVPPGSVILIVGRVSRLDAVSRLRVGACFAEIDADDLALEGSDVADVLADMGIDTTDEHVTRVLADTEGWPVGVRLAGFASLADLQQGLPGPSGVSGREASVANYIRTQWLWGLSTDEHDFLVRVSALDWLSGPLCNEVLGRHDAGEVLHRIFSERWLVIPLDRREDAYRMHGLLRDALAAEAERRDAEAVRTVHRRASNWFENSGDVDRAVRHAVAADDIDRVELLVVAHTPSFYTNGHYTTLRRWVESIPRERVLNSPALCLSAALAALGLGESATLSAWLRLGEHAAVSAPESDPMTRLCLLDLRSTTNTGPARPAADDAAVAYRGLRPGIWHAGACLAYGVWSWTVGDDIAVRVLTEGAEEAAVFGAPTLEAYCNAVLAMIAFSEGDSARAWSLAAGARQLAVDHGLVRTPGMAIVSAVHALSAASLGDPDTARSDWHLARSQLAQLKDLSGWANVQTRVALAHTSVLLGDAVGAETMLREAREFLIRQPDAVRAHVQVATLDDLLRRLRRHSTIGSSSLTTAELRVLHYLPTNLSLAEIGTRLYVSRYTVKTHCDSIYRKLNVNSRSQAVESARRVGLLENAGSVDAM